MRFGTGAAVAVLLCAMTVGSVSEARLFGRRGSGSGSFFTSGFSGNRSAFAQDGFFFSRGDFLFNRNRFGINGLDNSFTSFFQNPFFNQGINNFRFSNQFNTLNNFGFNGFNNLFFNPFALNRGSFQFNAFNSFLPNTRAGAIPANIGPTGFGGGHVFNTGGFYVPLNPFFGSAALASNFDPFGRGGAFGFGNNFGAFGPGGHGFAFGGTFPNPFNGFGQGLNNVANVGFGFGGHGFGGCGSFGGHGGGCGVNVGGCGNFGHGGVGGCSVSPIAGGGLPGRPTLATSPQGVINEKFAKWRDLFKNAGPLSINEVGSLENKWPQLAGNGVRVLHQDCASANGATTYPYTVFLFSNGPKTWLNIKSGHVTANDQIVGDMKAGWGLADEPGTGALHTALKTGTEIWVKKALPTNPPVQGLNLETKMKYNNVEWHCKTFAPAPVNIVQSNGPAPNPTVANGPTGGGAVNSSPILNGGAGGASEGYSY